GVVAHQVNQSSKPQLQVQGNSPGGVIIGTSSSSSSSSSSSTSMGSGTSRWTELHACQLLQNLKISSDHAKTGGGGGTKKMHATGSINAAKRVLSFLREDGLTHIAVRGYLPCDLLPVARSLPRASDGGSELLLSWDWILRHVPGTYVHDNGDNSNGRSDWHTVHVKEREDQSLVWQNDAGYE
ncbi:unnamed protein product, partial [Amoebophrya sp. A25]